MINHSALVGVDNPELCPVVTGHFLTQKTATAFLQMQQAALADGINIGIASSYRSFERQVMIWNRKYRGENTVLDSGGTPIADWSLVPPQQRILAILRWSALPGASRHHWGTDLDVYAPNLLPNDQKLQLTPDEYDKKNGYFAPLTAWLDEHMQRFGFFRPYAIDKGGIAPEPWHLSYHPEAVNYQQLFTLEHLRDALIQHEIEGHSHVLVNLPLIWNKFVMNICENK